MRSRGYPLTDRSERMNSQRNSMRYSDQQLQDRKRRIMIRNWCIVVLVLVLAFGLFQLLRNIGSRSEVITNRLPCTADQNVMVFGDHVLYYDSMSIHCLTTSGSIRWTYTVGANAQMAVSNSNVVVWNGSQLTIVDRNGHPTYNETMPSEVQFARISDHYCAVVIGDDTNPELLIKDLDGTQVDSEIEAFTGLMLMDVGFYGDNDQYLWTLALDVYGVDINTVLNTMQVNKMNGGIVNLGQYLAYKALFEDSRLRVFTTQHLYTFDYKGVQDMSRTQLVYGWELIDSYIPQRGAANMLLAPTAQMTSGMTIKSLRVLSDKTDRNYTLPAECIGACIDQKYIYAFSSDTLYRAELNAQRFAAFPLKLNYSTTATSLIGITTNSYAILRCNDQVYAIGLPQ